MKILIVLLLLTFCGIAADITATTARVIDGDTVEFGVLNGERLKVRIAGIDAPEKSQPFGRDAAAMLETLLGLPPWTIHRLGVDNWGRMIATVGTEQGDLGAAMVTAGGAWAYLPYLRGLPYVAPETDARHFSRGLWARTDNIEPWVFRKSRKRP